MKRIAALIVALTAIVTMPSEAADGQSAQAAGAKSETRTYELRYAGVIGRGETVEVEVRSSIVVIDPGRGTPEKIDGVMQRSFSNDIVDARIPSTDHLTWTIGKETAPRPTSGTFVFHYPQALRPIPGRVTTLFFDVAIIDHEPGKPERVLTHTFPLTITDGGAAPRCLRIQRVADGLASGLKQTCEEPMRSALATRP